MLARRAPYKAHTCWLALTTMPAKGSGYLLGIQVTRDGGFLDRADLPIDLDAHATSSAVLMGQGHGFKSISCSVLSLAKVPCQFSGLRNVKAYSNGHL
jgi:hypothetical protein